MGRRRRNREPVIVGLLGPIVGLVILFVLLASGPNLHRAVEIMRGLLVFLLIGIVAAAIGLVLFLLVLKLVRPKPASPRPIALRPVPRRVPPAAPASTAPLVYTKGDTPWWERKPEANHPEPPTHRSTAADLPGQLRATDWYQFEKVVGLIFEEQGYKLRRRGGANPDGGIDLIIERDGQQTAVQCKRWRKGKVDVPKIREFLGALTDSGITKGIVVTITGFTLEAKQLAVKHGIDIIHDENLAVLISDLSPAGQQRVQAMLQDTTKYCPKCESRMVLREPEEGESWKPFWGCPRFPKCYGKLEDS